MTQTYYVQQVGQTSTIKPSNANTYMRHHFGSSTSVATKMDSGTSITRYMGAANPVVGKRVHFQDRIN